MYNIIKQIKGDQKGKMKKVLPIILSVFVIISITGNILLYSKLKSANTENQNLSASIVETKDSISDLENQISEVQADLSDTNTKNEELQSENESLQSEIETLELELDFLKSIEPMSVTMYALENCDTYSKPDETSEGVGGLTTNQEVHVTGQSKETGWYEIEINGSKQYVSDKYLSDTKMQVTKPSTTNNNQTSATSAPSDNSSTPEQTPSNLQPTIINGQTDASQLDWSNSFGPLEHAESGEGIHAY